MPQTLSFNLVHVVFSTKGRVPLIGEEIAPDLHGYLAGTVRRLGCDCFRLGGVQDDVHLALRLAATRISAKMVSELKTSSSVWMKERGVARFAWQRGYGFLSVGPADIRALVRYIDGQKAHHARRSFEEEMRGFCEKYHVPIDEQYAWD